MARINFTKGIWVAVNTLSGEIIATSKERCELMHRLVLLGYARI